METKIESTAASNDLAPFCDPEASRFALSKPWTKDGKRYATDGRVAVRLDAPGQPDDMPEGRVPNVDSILPPVDGEWLSWPEVDPCSECAGDLEIDCKKCHGDGECEGRSCGTAHQCGRCEGSGKQTCDACSSGGFSRYLFGKAELSRRLAYIISKLPNVVYLPQADSNLPVRFKFDGGGTGAVMPLHKEGSRC